MWVFDHKDFTVKDIVEVSFFEITIDEETNSASSIRILKDTGAVAKDIIAFKRDNDVLYWGIIEEINNESGKLSYDYKCKYITNIFDREIALGDTTVMNTTGVEDFLKQEIENNFTASDDTLLNLSYIDVVVTTHTPIQAEVSNVENGIYNFHTWLTNCTQNYNIVYSWSIVNKRLKLTIHKENANKELIDTKAMNIFNYTEVFETQITAKVIVLTDTQTYTLYLKTDRTTTTDPTDVNRAEGDVTTIYTEDYANAPQEALNVMKGNSYKHNITFSMQRYIPIGTPIAIKTLQSIQLDTYISSVKITQRNLYEYQCGNIRIKFIEKLLKEKKQ